MRNLIWGVASGYLQVAANAAYSLGSVPLALHYLGKEEFGLWALVVQLGSYLLLCDVGMLASVSRVLIDHKDNRDDGEYGAILLTSGLVFTLQGLIVAILGILVSPLAGMALDLPPTSWTQLRLLLIAQAILLGLGFVARFVSAPLFAHQRYDISNLAQSGQFLLMLGALWIALEMKLGVYSLIASSIVGLVWTTVIQLLACIRLGLFPRWGNWGAPSTATFFRLFSFGKDVFLLAVGWQLLSASQVIIITRIIGLDAAATWSICTKVFAVAQQIVWKINDFSFGAFSEMFVRGEGERLRLRFKDALLLTASTAVLVSVIGGVCNSDFVQMWTSNRISWPPVNDILMASLFVIHSVNRCHGGVVGITMQLRFARFIYFVEGAAFIGLAVKLVPVFGFAGMTSSAILCAILFSGLYGLFRSREQFECSLGDLCITWVVEPLKFLGVFLLVAAAVCVATAHLALPLRLVSRLLTLAMTGTVLFWFIGLSCRLRDEIRTRAYLQWAKLI